MKEASAELMHFLPAAQFPTVSWLGGGEGRSDVLDFPTTIGGLMASKSAPSPVPATEYNLWPTTLISVATLLAISTVAWIAMFHMMGRSSMKYDVAVQSLWERASGGVAMWVTMILAMMLPIATSPIVGSCYKKSSRFVPLEGTSFAAGYVTSCVALAVVVASVAGWLNVSASGVVSAIGILLIGAYQFTPLKLQALKSNKGDLFRSRIRATGSIPQDYSRGLRHASGCFASCGPSMVAPMFWGMTIPAFMVGLFVWMVLEQAGFVSIFLAKLIGAFWIVAGLFLLFHLFQGTGAHAAASVGCGHAGICRGAPCHERQLIQISRP